MTNQVVGKRPEQSKLLGKKPRGVSGGVPPAWAAEGAIQQPPALLEVRDCALTSRSLSVGEF